MPQVQLRLPEKSVKNIDKLVHLGRFRSRSDAIKVMVDFYEERERTFEFLKIIMDRRKEAEKNPKLLIPLDEIK